MKAQMTITVEDNDSINVNGPIGDKVLAYGLLEAARDAVQGYHARLAMQAMQAKGNGSGLIIPQIVPPRDLKGA